MLTPKSLSTIRLFALGSTGLICLIYAALCLGLKRPDPMPFWIPGSFGVIAAIVIFLSTGVANQKHVRQAFDEGYRRDTIGAQRFGYWIAIALYPIFGVLQYMDIFPWPVVFAAMGTLSGAAYLLAFVWNDIRGRGQE